MLHEPIEMEGLLRLTKRQSNDDLGLQREQ